MTLLPRASFIMGRYCAVARFDALVPTNGRYDVGRILPIKCYHVNVAKECPQPVCSTRFAYELVVALLSFATSKL